MRHDIDTARLALLAGVLFVALAAFGSCAGHGASPAAAQGLPWPGDPPTPAGEIDPVKEEAHILAAYYINEHGHPHSYRHGAAHGFLLDDDMAVINAVIERVASIRRHGWVEAARAYSHGPVFDPNSCTGISFGFDGAEPDCWAQRWPTLVWSRFRPGWMAVWRHAIDVRLGLVHDRCENPPLHWGCGVEQSTPPRGHGHCRDHERAARQGWCEVSCGVTHVSVYTACAAED